ncbi:hypothetical protein BABINDRAFT_163137 [Babjeviella inositovora NRRL Y-12698]|uniref:Uncharacterized protein n=1 Tax=Babjeviella inositovora NRRL Y-12698 TaxID=984486 RepID=A0A1E3QKB1_9ASCO|nr:uncharacterized protein BABINDRAFT_163137 [Babjeviella inositovora NRRL Y-12698]ODQ78121.1 hypothetical protein BABINDRAFT_163137 [Babjeviella inositovora NRRL Y-12698]
MAGSTLGRALIVFSGYVQAGYGSPLQTLADDTPRSKFLPNLGHSGSAEKVSTGPSCVSKGCILVPPCLHICSRPTFPE